MKKLIFLSLIVILSFSCQQTQKPVDTDLAKAEIAEVLDNLRDDMASLDVDGYMGYLAEDGIFFGTDESEFWDKSELRKQMSAMPDSIHEMSFPLDKREIRLTADGKSAFATEQYLKTEMFGPNLPMRIDYHLVKTNDSWMVDVITMNFIPYNEDLPIIINALKEKDNQ